MDSDDDDASFLRVAPSHSSSSTGAHSPSRHRHLHPRLHAWCSPQHIRVATFFLRPRGPEASEPRLRPLLDKVMLGRGGRPKTGCNLRCAGVLLAFMSNSTAITVAVQGRTGVAETPVQEGVVGSKKSIALPEHLRACYETMRTCRDDALCAVRSWGIS